MSPLLTKNEIIKSITDGLKGREKWPPVNNPELIEQMRTDPNLFLTKVLNVKQLWNGQQQIIDKLKTSRQLAIASGHALGKDYLTARLMLWFLYTHIPSIVLASSASYRQISKIIWGELSEAFHGANYVLKGRTTTNQIVVDSHKKWYALGFATKDVHGMPGKFQGFHQKNVMILFSEAQAIEPAIWDEAESLMTSGHVIWVAIGNPLVNFGKFSDCWRPGSGWDTLNMDCEKSPNFLSGEELIPGLCSRQWVKLMETKYGRKSPIFISRVNGQFPPSIEGAIVDRVSLDWATNEGLKEIQPGSEKIVGVDPAAHGSNKTVIILREGMRVTDIQKAGGQSTMVTAGQIVNMIKAGISKVYLDVTGIGTGIWDRLVEQGYSKQVIPVSFGGRPREVESDRTPVLKESEKFANVVTQMYYNVSQLLEKKRIAMPYDQDLAIQLLNRRIKTRSDGKLEIEGKEEFGERGYDSPDEADALALCFCDFVQPGSTGTPFVETVQDDELDSIFDR